MTLRSNDTVLFTETQRVGQWWVWLLVAVVVGSAWWVFLRTVVGGDGQDAQIGLGAGAWTLVIFAGLLLPAFVLSIRMTTTVTSREVIISYFPLYRRRIRCHEIRSCVACQYHPILEYGGWGIRWGFRRGIVYSVYGDHGVQLELINSKRLLIGSQQAEALARVVNDCKREAPVA